MKIIVTEEQYKLIIEDKDKYTKIIKKLFDSQGFEETQRILGINPIKLAQILDIPIKGDDFYNMDEVTAYMFTSELVKMNKEYKNCTLNYNGLTSNVEWVCFWNNDGEKLDTFSYSTPYYAGNTTPVSTDYLSSTDGEWSYDSRNDEDIFESFKNPDGFDNIDDLVEWFESEYLSRTYKIIETHYELLLPRYEDMKSED